MKDLTATAVQLSATIVRGVKTARVKLGRRPRKSLSRFDASPQRAVGKWRQDPERGGRTYTTVCVSLPVADLVAIDEVAELAQMSRSHFLRQAAKHFAEKVKGKL